MSEIIGIDLGTTNCALAYTRGEAVEQFAIPQLVHPGEEREEPLLPSFLFLEDGDRSSGVLAQKKGLENAGRLVSSAKSWLIACRAWIAPRPFFRRTRRRACHGSRRWRLRAGICQHLREAWNTKESEAILRRATRCW